MVETSSRNRFVAEEFLKSLFELFVVFMADGFTVIILLRKCFSCRHMAK